MKLYFWCLLLCLGFSQEAYSCRNALPREVFTREQVYAAAEVVVSGWIIESHRPKDKHLSFFTRYTFIIDKMWKSNGSKKSLTFDEQHSSCSQFRSNFRVIKKQKMSEQKKQIFYLKTDTHTRTLQVLRMLDGEDLSLQEEVNFLNKISG